MHIHAMAFPNILSNNSNQIQYNPSSAVRFNPTPTSATALTVFAFLLILFLLTFFFIFARRLFAFSHNIYTRPHRRRSALLHITNYTYNSFFTAAEGANRLDMPVLKCAAEDITSDCVVCLDQFLEGECVKVIPGCRHMFHPCCIDGWLRLHGSCPLCRCTKLTGEIQSNPICAARDDEESGENRTQTLERRSSYDNNHHVTEGMLARRNSM